MIHDWSRLFSADGFRWQMGLRTGDARSFFAQTPEGHVILAERSRLLDESPDDYLVLTDPGLPLLEETSQFAIDAGILDRGAARTLHSLGRELEPDFVLLAASTDGPIVAGGVVCFPSSWSLPEKIGCTLEQTHGPVPGLNPQLGERIRTALDRLPPGAAWERENWGLARDSDRNHHPNHHRKRLDKTTEPDEVWLRVERQVLYRLPRTNGLLFGIRLVIMPLAELMSVEEARTGLHRALETMPDDVAAYKGVLSVKPRMLG